MGAKKKGHAAAHLDRFPVSFFFCLFFLLMAWFAKKDGRNWYCNVSGGYVLFGSWVDADPLCMNGSSCNLESFKDGTFNTELKQTMGDKVLNEAREKVERLLEVKNQKTASPLKTQ